ncbi:MAG: hypothetical protein ACF8TS_17960 [Maioricimonas sp. JB049]
MRHFVVLVLFGILAVMTVGCGGGETGDTTEDPTVETDAMSEEEIAAEEELN